LTIWCYIVVLGHKLSDHISCHIEKKKRGRMLQYVIYGHKEVTDYVWLNPESCVCDVIEMRKHMK